MIEYGMVFTTEQLIEEMRKFKWVRVPSELHLHHTWKPTWHSFFKAVDNYGLDKAYQILQDSMKNYHVNVNGWADIGQHLTLMPDGNWVVGRYWNRDPVSISGRNYLGFAIEMVGNFDRKGLSTTEYNSLGYDKFQGSPQQESIVKLIKFMSEFFDFRFDKDIKLHREYSTKTCPGNGIGRGDFMEQTSSWAEEARRRLIELGITDGTRPKDTATREEIWTMLARLIDANIDLTIEKITQRLGE